MNQLDSALGPAPASDCTDAAAHRAPAQGAVSPQGGTATPDTHLEKGKSHVHWRRSNSVYRGRRGHCLVGTKIKTGLLLSAARRTSRLGSAARRGLEQSRDETVAARKDRDDLIDQREAARAETVSAVNDDSPHGDGRPNPRERRRSRRYRSGRQVASRQATTTTADR
jgi:hypothetical protein